MSQNLITQLQNTFSGRKRGLSADEFLFHRGDDVEFLFWVESGEVRLVRHQSDGQVIILQKARARSILAEASLYSQRYHCDAIALKTVLVHAIPKQQVLKKLQDDTAFNHAWSVHLAREVQQARFRSELLSLKTVAARLDAWLNWHDEALPARGEWKVLAEQLGVSPEALYRELARRF